MMVNPADQHHIVNEQPHIRFNEYQNLSVEKETSILKQDDSNTHHRKGMHDPN